MYARTTMLSLHLLVAALLLCLTPSLVAAEGALFAPFHSGRPGEEEGDGDRIRLPESVPLLSESEFYRRVLPEGKQQEPWMVFFFAPWCKACKAMLPLFLNASLRLDADPAKTPHADFALVNTDASRRLAEDFEIERYPTVIYTTGRGPEYWYRYDGAYTAESFALFSVSLKQASVTGSYATDVSAPADFDRVVTHSSKARVPFFVFVPKTSSSTPANQKEAAWNSVVNSAASVGNVDFNVIYESKVDDASTDPAYTHVVAAARRCAAEGKATGPAGEVLLSTSDRYRTPQCFSGEWVRSHKDRKSKKKRLNKEMSRQLDAYITINGYRAVEALNPGMLASFEEQPRHYLGLVLLNGTVAEGDTKLLPALRDMVQDANERVTQRGLPLLEELQLPRISWAYVDVTHYPMWLERFNVKAADCPAFIIVDARRDRIFTVGKRVPEFLAVRQQYPWKVNGEQQTILERFTADVLNDVYYGEKVGLLPKLAERLSYVRGLGWIYRMLRYEDMLFVTMVFALSFFTFLIFLAVVAEPLLDRYDAAQAKKKKQD